MQYHNYSGTIDTIAQMIFPFRGSGTSFDLEGACWTKIPVTQIDFEKKMGEHRRMLTINRSKHFGQIFEIPTVFTCVYWVSEFSWKNITVVEIGHGEWSMNFSLEQQGCHPWAETASSELRSMSSLMQHIASSWISLEALKLTVCVVKKKHIFCQNCSFTGKSNISKPDLKGILSYQDRSSFFYSRLYDVEYVNSYLVF